MPRQGIVKCLSLFFIVFLMCPKRIRPTAPIGKQQEYYHAVRKSLNDVNEGDFKFRPADWSINIIRQKDDETLLGVDAEPGFDLSDDEIRKFKLWPKGIIPYYIDVVSFNDKVLRDRIRLFLNGVNSVTRLSFLEMPSPPKDDNTRWVFFVNRRGQLGCADHSTLNFTNEGVQHVNLGYDCLSTGGELAEAVLSIAGIPPQHNSPDRDSYVKILEENIIPEKGYLFHKLNDDQWLFHDIKYDFSSAGHFHHHKHSANGRATIEIQDIYAGTSVGENQGFTSSDIKKLRMLYNYIVKKKENKVPECGKLFKRGRKSRHDTPKLSLPEPKPRRKPNRYLGLPENHHEDEHHEDEHHEDKHHEDKHHEDGDHEENEEGDSKVEEHMRSDEKSDDGNYDTDPPATRKMDLKSQPVIGKHNTFELDPLSYLSDYQTGDENRRKVGQKKNPKKQ